LKAGVVIQDVAIRECHEQVDAAVVIEVAEGRVARGPCLKSSCGRGLRERAVEIVAI
jgi:hypothetical protein